MAHLKEKCLLTEGKGNKLVIRLTKLGIKDGTIKLHQCSYCEHVLMTESEKLLHEKSHVKDGSCIGLENWTVSREKHVIENNQAAKETCEMKPTKKLYQCKICKKVLSSASSIKRHQKMHRGASGQRKITFYDKKFQQIGDRIKHEMIHPEKKPHPCSYCGKRCMSNYHQNMHERTHKNSENLKCRFCEQSFRSSSTKIKHEMTHTGEKPHVCQYCDQRFRLKSSLNRHIRIHTGDKRYYCQICNKAFVQLREKKLHERVHTGEKPFKCQFCETKFSQKSSKNEHENRIHTGKKAYECHFCTKRFHRKQGRRQHELGHTGNRPFIVGKNFIQLGPPKLL